MAIKTKASFFADDGTRSFTRKTWFRLLGWPDETRFRNLFGPTLSTLGSLVDDLVSATLPGFGIAAAKADITARTEMKLADASVSGTNMYPIAVGPHQLPIVVGTAGQVTVVKNAEANANADTYQISLVNGDSGWVDVPGGQRATGSSLGGNGTVAITWASSAALQERRIGDIVFVRGEFTVANVSAPSGLVLTVLTYPPPGSTLREGARSTQFLNENSTDNVLLEAYAASLPSVGNDSNGVAKSGGRLAIALLANGNYTQTHRFYLSYAVG